MLRGIVRGLRRLLPSERTGRGMNAPEPPVSQAELTGTPLSHSLAANLADLQTILGHPDDLVIREFLIANRFRAAFVGIDGLVDRDQVHAYVMRALMVEVVGTDLARQLTPANVMTKLYESIISVGEVSPPVRSLEEVTDAVLFGRLALLVEGHDRAFDIDLRGWEKRAIEEPPTESVIRGPREGFVEHLRTNTAQIRRRIKSPNLRFEAFTLGRITQTRVVLSYLKGTANDAIVEEARRRISRIDLDGILESGYVEEFIEDSPFSPFPTLLATERPDAVAAALLEGRLAIFTEGTPFVLVAPALFPDFLSSPEDYYQKVQVVVLVRTIRTLAAFFTMTLPSIYVALTTYHQEMLPTPLALSIAAGREGTPFPAIFEAFGMQLIFEVLREAGTRLPRQLGQAVSIVGALVIGQAAVAAGLVSPLMVIIVALTGIGSFVIPHSAMVLALRILSFPMLLMAGLFGFAGITFFLLLLLAHLASQRSFGVPYLTPFAPSVVPDLKDSFTRLHWWWMDTRPWYIAQRNLRRQGGRQKPRPPEKAQGGPRDPSMRREGQ